jgi:Flp pilus assembly pilin Flp
VNLRSVFNGWFQSDDGQDIAEFAILLGLIALAVLVFATLLGGSLDGGSLDGLF